ncbi:MAG: hypothetical protein IJH35_04375 [Methanobrevibacter sp.]|nr:hypothetical protein [Methanobrevibacter sp.]
MKSGIAPKSICFAGSSLTIQPHHQGKHKGFEPFPQASQTCMLTITPMNP